MPTSTPPSEYVPDAWSLQFSAARELAGLPTGRTDEGGLLAEVLRRTRGWVLKVRTDVRGLPPAEMTSAVRVQARGYLGMRANPDLRERIAHAIALVLTAAYSERIDPGTPSS